MVNFWSQLNKPFTVLAPMSEVTDVVFREILLSTARPDVFYTEFVSTEALFSRGKEVVAKKLKFTPKQHPIVAQIWGTEPKYYRQAAELIQSMGFDGIDINMGCPDKDVMKQGAGAALIDNLTLAHQLIEATKKGAPNIPLSIKTRLAKTKDQHKEWMTFLLKSKIQALTLHARTAKAMSKVPANWEAIGELVKLKNALDENVCIIGNGDITSFEEVLTMQSQYGVDGIMIGRGVFNNPWVFEKSITPTQHTTKEHIELLLHHTKLFNDTWGTTTNYSVMKKYFKIYVKDFRGASEVRQRLMDTQNYQEFTQVMNHYSQLV